MFFSCLVTLLMTIVFAPIFISFLKRKQFGQSIREEGPKHHQKKSGTPTIGGIIFLVPVLISSFIFLHSSKERIILLLLTFGFAFIGFLDDSLKVFLKRNLGLTAKQKLLLQIILSVITYIVLVKLGFDTKIYVPKTHISFDLGWGYIAFFLFFSVGTTNATNLTDGLDGLLTGLSIIALGSYAWISYASGEKQTFEFALIMIGSLLGFLAFNFNPAKVFMGDTGSLSLGGALVGLAVLTKTEILLAVIGGVFVLETLSVLIQVFSYKTFKKRVFKMTPIHHSFEMIGWNEQKVVLSFWFGGLILAILSLSLYTI